MASIELAVADKPYQNHSPIVAQRQVSFNTARKLRPKSAWTSHTADKRDKKLRNILFKSQSNFGPQKLMVDSETINKTIWEAFGIYISKQIRSGKGVGIPKLGHFTFTARNVDLAGSTMPHVHDLQQRYPVFVIEKGFAIGTNIKPGIAGGMTPEVLIDGTQPVNQTLRIFVDHGVNGIIPKVKLNYFEIASLTNNVASKDDCRLYIESMIKSWSDNIKLGKSTNIKIPRVGKLIIKPHIAGVIFDNNLISDAYGKTALAFQHLFSKTNQCNNSIHQPNFANYGATMQSTEYADSKPYFMVSQDAKSWMKSNLDLNYDDEVKQAKSQQTPMRKSNRPQRLMSASRANMRKSNFNLDNINIHQQSTTKNRPASAFFGKSIISRPRSTLGSTSSQICSVVSKVPELAPFQFMNFANEWYNRRSSIVEYVRSEKSGVSMRDVLSSSQILKIFQRIGIKVKIGELKAVLQEIGFNWNGPSCTIMQLIQRLKEYLNPEAPPPFVGNEKTGSEYHFERSVTGQAQLLSLKKQEGAHTTIEIIRECFYSTGETLYQLYRRGTFTNKLEFEGFSKIVMQCSHCMLNESDLKNAFRIVNKGSNREYITYQDFEETFKIDVPYPKALRSETSVISKVREWMFQRQYATEAAFQRLLRSCDRWEQKTMGKLDFHKAIIINQVPITAPEIDFLFDTLSGQNKLTHISIDEWSSYIYDDVQNPLQLIRETIQAQNMDVDDILFQMKLKIWDEPLDYKKFLICIRTLDASFSETQAQVLFSKLKRKDGKVDIQTMLSNVTGSHEDTVDYKNKMFKQLYTEIYEQNKQKEFLKLLENYDNNHDGKIVPRDLERVLKQITGGTKSQYTDDQIMKFVRQLQKDDDYKISYNEFLEKICSLGNKNHNPFKTLIQRLAYFIETNKLTVPALLKRLSNGENKQISVVIFTDFLKAKVDKKRSQVELHQYAQLIDVDKDGYIGEEDLKTCLRNINSSAFFENDGLALSSSQFNSEFKFFPTQMNEDLSDRKLINLVKEFRKAMIYKKVSYQKLFRVADTESVGLINFGQFSKSLLTVMPISPPILEKVFNIMDSNQIGMIDFYRFEKVLRAETPSQIPKPGKTVKDSFAWQEDIIARIKVWAKKQKLNSLDAFRSFDQDFNGLITKEDMRVSLIKYLNVAPKDIYETRLDRLFRLLSFYKTETIQQSDFERLLNDVNPYLTSSTSEQSKVFQSSMGGGFTSVSTHDWKFAAIQQIGLIISQKYASVEDSFKDAAGPNNKVDFSQFQAFIFKHNALKGFNLTTTLTQKIFAEIDPHKKTYLSKKDWLNTFSTFNEQEIILIELKNFLQCQFTNSESAFAFLLSFGTQGASTIDFETFSKAVTSLIASRKLTVNQKKYLFKQFAHDKNVFNQSEFMKEFDNIIFTGKQSLVDTASSAKSGRSKSHGPIGKINNPNSEASRWEADIFDKLKRIIKSSGKTLDAIFSQFDVDGSGDISYSEFYQAMKLLSLGLSDNEIYKIRQRVDANNDGMINYLEFAAKFRDDKEFDKRMKLRANDRIAHMKEQMIHYMTSTTEAFRMFDSRKNGALVYLDFDRLVRELAKLSNQEVPCYSVIKDMFDAIDTAGDALIDLKEWNTAFGGIYKGDARLSVKATPLSFWENSAEAQKLGTVIARNRKLLTESFKKHSTHSDYNGEARFVTFEQAKKAMASIISVNFPDGLSDDKLACILRVGQVVQQIGRFPDLAIYDFMKILSIYKDRYQGPQFV